MTTATNIADTRAAKPEPPRKTKSKAAKSGIGFVHQILVIAGILAIWQLVSMTPMVDTESLPSPVMVFQALITLMGTPAYWLALWSTIKIWAIGLGISALIGIPLGLMLGASRRASASTSWVVDFFRTIPTVALLPLVLLLFGPTGRMEITMIVLSAVWPILIQSMASTKQVEPLLKWVVKTFRIGTFDRIRYLWMPSVSLLISTGMRLAATMALLMTITAEYLGGAPGLGQQLSLSELAFNRPAVFAYAFTAGILGLLINLILVQIQRRTLWWHPIIRGESV